MRTTVTIDDAIYKPLKVYAVERGITFSALVQEALVQQILEDAEDVEDAIAAENEPTYLWEDIKADYKKRGLL